MDYSNRDEVKMNQTKVVEEEPYNYYDYSDWYSNNMEPTRPPKE